MRNQEVITTAENVETLITFEEVAEICKEKGTDITPEQIICRLGTRDMAKLQEISKREGGMQNWVRTYIDVIENCPMVNDQSAEQSIEQTV